MISGHRKKAEGGVLSFQFKDFRFLYADDIKCLNPVLKQKCIFQSHCN